MICNLLLVLSAFSMVALLAGEVWRAKREVWRARAIAEATSDGQRRVVRETRAVCSQVLAYCWQLEGIVKDLAWPKHGEPVGLYHELCREALDGRPPVVPLLAAIETENWAELERIQHGG